MRKHNKVTWLIVIIIAVSAAALAGATVANHQFSIRNPGGYDFLVQWVSTRSFLIDGSSPYSDETAARILGLADSQLAEQDVPELRVTYPMYSILFMIPFSIIGDYTLARAIWMTLLELSLILTATLSLRLVSWRPHFLILVVYFLFSVLWHHAVGPLEDGNFIILVTLFIVGGLYFIQKGSDELAGILIALATIKPNVVLLLIVFVLFWALINRRWRLITWLIGSEVLLVAAGLFFLPDWILQYFREIIQFLRSNPFGTPVAALATLFPAQAERLGWVLTGIVAGMLLIEWFRARRSEQRGFLWTACFTLVVTLWSGIQTNPGNFLIVFPAIVMILALLDERWRRIGVVVGLGLMILLTVGSWWISQQTSLNDNQVILNLLVIFLLPALLILLLYWVRWWAFHPVQTWFDLVFDKDQKSG